MMDKANIDRQQAPVDRSGTRLVLFGTAFREPMGRAVRLAGRHTTELFLRILHFTRAIRTVSLRVAMDSI
jgi:hypothetical protein